MSVYYGPLRLPDPKPVLMTWPTVSKLPNPDASTPKRIRNVTCPHLRIDGAPVTEYRPRSRFALGMEITTGYCAQRHMGITGTLIGNLCASSWSRTCPFLPEAEGAA